jgi:hypothetical protein
MPSPRSGPRRWMRDPTAGGRAPAASPWWRPAADWNRAFPSFIWPTGGTVSIGFPWTRSLSALREHGIVILGFYRRTMATHAGRLTREGASHAGVILLRRSVSQMDYGKQRFRIRTQVSARAHLQVLFSRGSVIALELPAGFLENGPRPTPIVKTVWRQVMLILRLKLEIRSTGLE